MLATILRALLLLGTGFTSADLLVLQAAADATDGAVYDEVLSHCHARPGTGHSAM
jgi:hypothetical protein